MNNLVYHRIEPLNVKSDTLGYTENDIVDFVLDFEGTKNEFKFIKVKR